MCSRADSHFLRSYIQDKFVGAWKGCDKTFVKQFQNLFIVLNDRREVIGWPLTRTAFEEIQDLLVALIVAMHCLWNFLWQMRN